MFLQFFSYFPSLHFRSRGQIAYISPRSGKEKKRRRERAFSDNTTFPAFFSRPENSWEIVRIKKVRLGVSDIWTLLSLLIPGRSSLGSNKQRSDNKSASQQVSCPSQSMRASSFRVSAFLNFTRPHEWPETEAALHFFQY